MSDDVQALKLVAGRSCGDCSMCCKLPQIDELSPASVRSAVLLRKTDRSQVPIKPDFVCFDIPDAFVVGYGLDYRD